MTDLLTQYGPVGGLVGVAFILAGAVATLVKQRRNGNGHDDARGSLLGELRDDIRELRQELRESRHEIRQELQPLVTKVALLEREVASIQRTRPASEHRSEPR